VDLHGFGHRCRDLALDRQYVLQVAVKGLGPFLEACSGLHQLGADPHPAVGPPDTAVQQVGHAQPGADLATVGCTALELEGRGPGDHLQQLDARQGVDQLFGQAVREIVLGQIAAQIGEGQDGYAVWRGSAAAAKGPPGACAGQGRKAANARQNAPAAGGEPCSRSSRCGRLDAFGIKGLQQSMMGGIAGVSTPG